MLFLFTLPLDIMDALANGGESSRFWLDYAFACFIIYCYFLVFKFGITFNLLKHIIIIIMFAFTNFYNFVNRFFALILSRILLLFLLLGGSFIISGNEEEENIYL